MSAITYGDILTVLPFGNRVDSFEMQGKYIWEAMERSVTELNRIHTNLDHMLHVSGTHFKSQTKSKIYTEIKVNLKYKFRYENGCKSNSTDWSTYYIDSNSM